MAKEDLLLAMSAEEWLTKWETVKEFLAESLDQELQDWIIDIVEGDIED